jgi:hypothetical protein
MGRFWPDSDEQERTFNALAMVRRGPTAAEDAEFEKMWTSLEGARIRRSREPEPEDKLKPLFKAGRAGYQQFYVQEARGYQWQCWCISEYVNAAGYFLMWLRGRKKKQGSLIEDRNIMAAKDRSVLMRRVEKYQQESWNKRLDNRGRRIEKLKQR